MAPPVIIEEMLSDRVVEIGRLSGTEAMVVGREPEFGVKVPDATAISREHGVFIPYGNHWLYKDLSSTNGSSHRGERLLPETPVVVRLGEIVELAGHLVRLSLDVSLCVQPPTPAQSLLVLQRAEVKKELLIQDTPGVLLAIGGKEADLKLQIDIEEHPSLIVERRGQGVVAYSVSKSGDLALNGAPMLTPLTLKDRDELTVGTYRCIFLDELYRSSGATTKIATWDDEVAPAFRTPTGRYKAKRSFGQLPDSKGTAKTEDFVARRKIGAGDVEQPDNNPMSTGIILLLIFLFCGGLGLLVAFLL
jgi:pSer/pThr/pTyr-binding forkhead associated (FHA) protein